MPTREAFTVAAEGLFRPGEDYLVASTGGEMREHLAGLLADEPAARAMAARGRERILTRHTCAHRVDELLAIVRSLGSAARSPTLTRSA